MTHPSTVCRLMIDLSFWLVERAKLKVINQKRYSLGRLEFHQ